MCCSDAGHRRDGLGPVDALLDEQRRDQTVDREPGLGDEPPQGGGSAKAPQAPFGERHAIRLPVAEHAENGGDETVDVVRIGLDRRRAARPRSRSRT